MHLLINSLHELDDAAQKIIEYAGSQKTFLFYGDMGAGKTTLIKSLCKQLGTNDNVASPTFSIVNEYNAPGRNIYHFDFYRLKTQTEALDMGFEEYLYSGNYCFIEWPENDKTICRVWHSQHKMMCVGKFIYDEQGRIVLDPN